MDCMSFKKTHHFSIRHFPYLIGTLPVQEASGGALGGDVPALAVGPSGGAARLHVLAEQEQTTTCKGLGVLHTHTHTKSALQ